MAKLKATTKGVEPKRSPGVETIDIEKFKKAFGPVRKARLALAAQNQPKYIVVPDMTRREIQALAKKAGLDLQTVEQKAQRQTAEVLSALEKNRKQAIKYSKTAERLLDGSAAAWVNGAQTALQGTVGRYFLDTPFLIWPTPTLALDAATIQPANSTVKLQYHVESGDRGLGGIEEVSILFRWTNPSDYPTTISVDGYMVFSGTAEAVSYGGWGPDGDATSLAVYGWLEVYGNWDNSHTLLSDALAEPVSLYVLPKGWYYHHTVSSSVSVFRGYDIHIDQIAVPSNGEITLNLSLQIWESLAGRGKVNVDFASAPAYGVTAVGILITKWN